MAREFQRGHKARISDLTAGTDLYVGVQITGPGLTFDISCFGLDADERLSDDRYFVFFNQPKSPEESIQLLGAQAGDSESFRVTLDRIPANIQKLSFTATIDGAGQMSQIAPGYVRIVAGGEEVARYSFNGTEFSTERAVMLGDFYLKDVWRFAAVGQGFDGGLDALLKNFGGEVAEEEPAAAPPQQSGAPSFAPPAQAAAPPAFGAPATPAPAQQGYAPPQGATPPPAPAPAPPPVHAAPTIIAPLATPPGTMQPLLPRPPRTRRPSDRCPVRPRPRRRATVSRPRLPATDSSPRRRPRRRATVSRPRLPATGSSRPVSSPASRALRRRTGHLRVCRKAEVLPVSPPRSRRSARRPPVSGGPCRTRS